ncbi:MAG: pilin [bacterium]|nr:pilin [bacterium]
MFNNLNNIKTLFGIIIIIAIVIAPFSFLNAQPTPSKSGSEFIEFLNWLFSALLSVAAILAFVMIVIAGFKWVASAGNPAGIEDAKDMITKAILGLVLAFAGWLILNTINPALVGGGGGGGLPGGGSSPTEPADPAEPTDPSDPTAPGDTLSEQEARDKLAAAGISVNKAPCPAGVSYKDVPGGCTSLEGIPESTINSLIAIKKQCVCSITVTGGTEAGHKTHGPGIPIVDLSFDESLGRYLHDNASALGISSICTDAAHQQQYSHDCGFVEIEEHLHVVF